MGLYTDMVVEMRDHLNAPWRVVLAPPDVYEHMTAKSYTTTGLLAGVRNEAGFTPLVEMRGLPEDSTGEAVTEWFGRSIVVGARFGEHHVAGECGMTWLTLRELNAVDLDDDETGQQTTLPEWVPWLRTLGEPDDVRVTVGFD